MKIDFYLAVSSGGAVRATKNRPTLQSHEISMGMTLEIPNSLFQKPQLQARIVIDDKAVTPPVLTAETIEGTRHAIEQSTGMSVQIIVVDETQGGKS